MGVSIETAVVYYDRMLRVPNTITAPLEDASDGLLVDLARHGDENAFEALVRRYRNDVYRLACHFVHDREEAWDLSQEVFIKAYRALWRFRGEAQFKTWLMHIVANQCRDHLRRRRLPAAPAGRQPCVECSPVAGEPDRLAEAAEIGLAIEQALESLPHKHRTAFILREYEGMSYDEMARVMGCRLGTVMSRLHHARRKLQEKLAEAGVVEGTNHG